MNPTINHDYFSVYTEKLVDEVVRAADSELLRQESREKGQFGRREYTKLQKVSLGTVLGKVASGANMSGSIFAEIILDKIEDVQRIAECYEGMESVIELVSDIKKDVQKLAFQQRVYADALNLLKSQVGVLPPSVMKIAATTVFKDNCSDISQQFKDSGRSKNNLRRSLMGKIFF